MRDDLADLVETTHQLTGISTGLIEKDYYVTRVLSILSSLDHSPFKLIFSGGTCLAKAHKITKRMSEDIDFKIEQNDKTTPLSTKSHRKEFSKLREKIVSILNKAEFKCETKPTEGRNNHVKIYVNYPAHFPKDINARDYILLELTISKLKLPSSILSINSIIQDTLNNITISKDCSLECASVEETAVEKWVALTRRIAYAVRYQNKEMSIHSALVRHVYDLFIISKENKLGEEFVSLAKQVIDSDKLKYQKQHQEYFNNPIEEIKFSLLQLEKPEFQNFYVNLIESLVYDGLAPSYINALKLLNKISNPIIKLLTQNEI